MEKLTISSVYDKFIEKGFDPFFFYQVVPISFMYIPSVEAIQLYGSSVNAFRNHVQSNFVQESLQYWNTWIDYQNYR